MSTRTAIGTYGGTLKDVAAPDLGAAVIRESLQRAGLAPDKVQSVIMGIYDGLNDAFSGKHSGWHTEDLVSLKQISREDQDRWALRSQQRFSTAQAGGKFDAEIVTIEVPGRKGPTLFTRDEPGASVAGRASPWRLSAFERLVDGWPS